MARIHGWSEYPAIQLKSVPKSKDDLVMEVEYDGPAGDGYDWLHSSKEDALEAAHKRVLYHRDVAAKNIAFIDTPGAMRYCPSDLVAKWKADAKEEHRIAEAALALFA